MFNNMLMGAAGESIKATSFPVDNSAMFNDDDSEYLIRTSSSASNQKTWTFSTWIKRANIGANGYIFDATGRLYLRFVDSSFKLEVGNASNTILLSTQVFRDPHAWLHIVWNQDSTQATASNRMRIYVNGTEITDFDTDNRSSQISQNSDQAVNNNVAHYIGKASDSSTYNDQYLAQTVLVDGQQLAPTSFGETDDNGIWRPIDLDDSGLFTVSSTAEAIVNSASGTNSGDLSTYTYSSVALGTASSTRAIYVFATGQGPASSNFDVNSMTVGGVSATRVADVTNSAEAQYVSELWRADVPSGTTGDIVVTWNSAMSQCGIIAWAVTGDHSLFDIQTTSDSTASFTLTSVPNGSVILAGRGGTGSRTHTWSSDVTENVDEVIADGVVQSGASSAKSTGGNFTVTCTPSTSDTRSRTVSIVLSPTQGAGINGFYLPFTTSTFLGADYSASGTQTTFNAASDWTGSTGSYTFTQGSIEADTGDKAVKSDQTFAGDFEFQWRYVAKANWVIGVYDTAEDGTFNDSNSSGGMASMTDSFYVQASSVSANNDIFYGNSVVVNATTIANGDTWKITRVSGTLKIFRNGSEVHEFSQTNSDTMRIVFAQGDTAADADSISWVDGTGSVGNNFFSINAPTQTSDSPTKNYAVLSPLNLQANIVLSEGNLKQASSSNSQGMSFSSFPVTTGQKVYIEATISGASGGMTGCVKSTSAVPQNPSSDFDALASGDARLLNVANGDVFSADGVTVASNYAPNDSVPVTHMIALDLVNDKIYWGDAGVGASGWSNGSGSFNQAFSSAVGVDLDANLDWFFAMRGYNATIEVNFGATAFTVDPPTGYSSGYSAAIENENRETALTIEDGSKYMQSTLYTGNGGSQSINQSGNSTFKPDLLWTKKRASGTGGHALFDIVRTTSSGQFVRADNTDEEKNEAGFASFDSDGFSWDGAGTEIDINANTSTFVAWQWLAGNSTGSSNSNGSITSTVSVNQTAGFSIVRWSGSGANATIGHGLGVAPSWLVVKALSASNSWRVYHAANTSAPETEFLELNAGTATTDEATIWNDTAPTSTVFSVGSDGGSNVSGTDNMIAYCWCEKPGFSKFGSYIGNGGSGNGPFLSMGFSPSWIMYKNTTQSAGWRMYDSTRDPHNVAEQGLTANTANAEKGDQSAVQGDFLSNGWKVRNPGNTADGGNVDGNVYVYMAFAENPFAGTTPTTAR